jgi:metal-dependent amidase/aminoacylase/carboxypeptidase family protein
MHPDVQLSKALAYVDSMTDRLIAWRREFHLHPELSGEEVWTSTVVAEHLDRLGLKIRENVGGHGVVGLLGDPQSETSIAYRADMDALPIQDALDKPYRALPLGIKHACGHDAHITVALGVAEALVCSGARLPGTLKLIFQPAEESLDGARAMIEDGILGDPRPNALLAMHAFPLPAGTIGMKAGPCLAGMDEFEVRFYAPAGNLNPLVQRAKGALEGLSSGRAPMTTAEFEGILEKMLRENDLQQITFVSAWPLTEDQTQPSHLLGLVSIVDFDRRPQIHACIRETLDAVSSEMGASYDLNYTFTNPPLHNDPELIDTMLPQLKSVLGDDGILRLYGPYPFAHEDLALYAQEIPTALLWLGTANRVRDIPSLLHTASYDIDESALLTGTKAALATIWSVMVKFNSAG